VAKGRRKRARSFARTPESPRKGRALGFALPLLFLLLFLLTTLLAVAGRTVPHYPSIFPEQGDVRLLGVDSYYHLRHTRFTAENFPRLMRKDIGTHFPTGLRDDAAGLFNVALAAVALATRAGQPVEQQIPAVLAWSPVVFFALASFAMFHLASGLAGRGAGLVCCALFFLFPGEALERTTLGFGDYHSAEILLAIWTVMGVLACIERSRSPAPPPLWRPAFASCLPFVLFLFTWRGAPLYLPLIAFSFLLVGLHDLRHGANWRAAAAAAFRYGAGVLLLAGGVAFLFPSSVIVPRFFPPSLVSVGVLSGALGMMVAPAVGLSVAGAFVASRWKPNPGAVALAAFLSISGAALIFALHSVSPPSTTWVSEAQPVTLSLVGLLLGPIAFLGPIAVPVTLIASWRRPDDWRALVVLAFACPVGFIWVRANDFGYLVPPFAALMTTLVVVAVARWLRLRLGPLQQTTACAVGVILLVTPIWPLEWVRKPWFVAREGMMLVNDGWIESMHWLRDATPQPSLGPTTRVEGRESGDFRYPSGAYGVLSAWDAGNFVAAIGERIPTSSRFPIRRTATLLFGPSLPEAGAALCAECEDDEAVRYVVIDARTVSDSYRSAARMAGQEIELDVQEVWDYGGRNLNRAVFGKGYRGSLAARLFFDDAERLGTYRLVHESRSEHVLAYRSSEFGVVRTSVHVNSPSHRAQALRWIAEGSVYPSPLGLMYDPVIVPSVKIFEHVEGARVVGTAQPRSEVEARLALTVETTGRPFVYRQTVQADGQGRFELVLPYSTGGASFASAVEPNGPYRLRGFSPAGTVGSVQLELTEEQVAGGERVDAGAVGISPSQR